MKRVLCIVSSLDTGGAETFMMKIFRGMPEEYKMDFIVSTNYGYYENEVICLGGKIHRIPLRTKKPITSFFAIRSIVKKNRYEYVLKLCDTPIGVFDLLAAREGGAKVLCVRSCNASSSESSLKRIVNQILRPVLNKVANVKLAPSRLAAEYTFGKKEVDQGKVTFLKNAVDLNIYKFDEKARKSIRESYGINDKQLVCGHIGRFNYQKNHKFLIDTFKSVVDKQPDAVLLLVGTGELLSDIKKQISSYGIGKNVIFCGVRSDVPELLSAMDVFLLPSWFEGMPNTVIEAQAVGIPAVISDRITKEANITNNIKYLPIEDKDTWVAEILRSWKSGRIDSYQSFVLNKYDIQSSVMEFIKCIFGKE